MKNFKLVFVFAFLIIWNSSCNNDKKNKVEAEVELTNFTELLADVIPLDQKVSEEELRDYVSETLIVKKRSVEEQLRLQKYYLQLSIDDKYRYIDLLHEVKCEKARLEGDERKINICNSAEVIYQKYANEIANARQAAKLRYNKSIYALEASIADSLFSEFGINLKEVYDPTSDSGQLRDERDPDRCDKPYTQSQNCDYFLFVVIPHYDVEWTHWTVTDHLCERNDLNEIECDDTFSFEPSDENVSFPLAPGALGDDGNGTDWTAAWQSENPAIVNAINDTGMFGGQGWVAFRSFETDKHQEQIHTGHMLFGARYFNWPFGWGFSVSDFTESMILYKTM